MRRIYSSVVYAFLVIGILLWASPMISPAHAAGFKKEYKMTVNVGPNFYWGMGAAKFCELVKEKICVNLCESVSLKIT